MSNSQENNLEHSHIGRPVKETVDFFSHDCIPKKTLHILETKFKNDGYAVWYKTLERLGASPKHYISLNDPIEVEYIASKMNVDSDKLFSIIDLCAKLSAIDKKLWENKIIWSQNFVDRLAFLYTKRKASVPKKPTEIEVEKIIKLEK